MELVFEPFWKSEIHESAYKTVISHENQIVLDKIRQRPSGHPNFFVYDHVIPATGHILFDLRVGPCDLTIKSIELVIGQEVFALWKRTDLDLNFIPLIALDGPVILRFTIKRQVSKHKYSDKFSIEDRLGHFKPNSLVKFQRGGYIVQTPDVFFCKNGRAFKSTNDSFRNMNVLVKVKSEPT